MRRSFGALDFSADGSLALAGQVILMSATIDVTYFAEYFSTSFFNKLEPAPVVEIPGKMMAVKEYYINSLRTLGEVSSTSRRSAAPGAATALGTHLQRVHLASRSARAMKVVPNWQRMTPQRSKPPRIVKLENDLRHDRCVTRALPPLRHCKDCDSATLL